MSRTTGGVSWARLSFILCLLLAAAGKTTLAGDAHYWNHPYGTESGLLGGTVVGGVEDVSAAFYNPGALTRIHEPGILINVDVYKLQTIHLKHGIGSGADLRAREFASTPVLTAGVLPRDLLPGQVLAYSILTRHSFNGSLYGRKRATLDVLDDSPGDEEYVGEYLFETNLQEIWGGLSWSCPVHEKVSIGATAFLAVRSHRVRQESLAQAYSSTADSAVTNTLDEAEYLNLRTLFKVGAAADIAPFTFGLTLTSGSIHLYGDGSSRRNVSMLGQDLDDDGTEDTVVNNDRQKGLNAKYRSPFAVAVGATLDLDTIRVYFSAEWFGSLSRFRVMDGTTPGADPLAGSVDLDVYHECNAVFNVGLGVSMNIVKSLDGYASFRTDFSALEESGDSDLAFAAWDVYHLLAGVTFEREQTKLCLGFGFSFGSCPFEQVVNFSDPDESNALLGTVNGSHVFYRSYEIVLGYTFKFR